MRSGWKVEEKSFTAAVIKKERIKFVALNVLNFL